MKSIPRRLPSILGLLLLFISAGLNAQTRTQALAPTPPMGFNSFDSYLTYLSEDKAHALIDVMAEKYLPFGYNYFVIDAGWARNVELYPGTMHAKKVIGVSMDEFGMPDPSKMYFPNGIKAIADHCHRKGLKFGVWFIRGIPREEPADQGDSVFCPGYCRHEQRERVELG
jgi:hypothetical protein